MVAITPAAAALVGLAAERAAVGLSRRGPLARTGAVALCGLFALRPLAVGIAGFAPVPFNAESVAAQTEIAAALKPTFYADRDAFEAHVAEFNLRARARVASGLQRPHVVRLRDPPGAGARVDREECLAMVAKSDVDGDPREGLAASPSLAGLGAVFREPAVESRHFLYFPYATRDGNCLKTFPNAYVPTAFEAAHLRGGRPCRGKARRRRCAVRRIPAGPRRRDRRRNPPRGRRLCRGAARQSAARLYRALFPLDRRPVAVLCRRAGGLSGQLRRRHRRVAAARPSWRPGARPLSRCRTGATGCG